MAASIRENSKPFPDAFKQISPSGFFGCSQNPNMRHKRIKSSAGHEKLMQHIKNISPKCGSYTGWNSSTGDGRDSFPSLVLNTHTATADLKKHSSSLGMNSHQIKSLLPKTSVKWAKLRQTNILHLERWKSNRGAGPHTLNQPFPQGFFSFFTEIQLMRNQHSTPALCDCHPALSCGTPPAMHRATNAAISALHKTQSVDIGNRNIKVKS